MPISRVGVKFASGFSLLEALIVIVLVAFIAAIVAPSLSTAYRGVVLKSTVRSIAGTLRYTRARAVGASEAKVFAIDFEKRAFSVMPLKNKTDANTDTKQLITRSIANYLVLNESAGGETSELASKQALAIKFFPNGGSTGGRLTLGYRQSLYVIDVNPFTGAVSVDIESEKKHKIASVMLTK